MRLVQVSPGRWVPADTVVDIRIDEQRNALLSGGYNSMFTVVVTAMPNPTTRITFTVGATYSDRRLAEKVADEFAGRVNA